MRSYWNRPFDFEQRKAFWFYNINQEQVWNTTNVLPSVFDEKRHKLVIQQEQQLLYVAGPGDTVLFRHQPDTEFLHYLQEQGITLPRITNLDGENLPFETIREEQAMLVPYIVTSELQATAAEFDVPMYNGMAHALIKQLNNKLFTRQFAQQYGFAVTRGRVCHTVDELTALYYELKEEGFEKVVLKIPFGSSGKGLRVISSDRAFQSMVAFIRRRSQPFEVLLEGWHPTKRSLNCQLLIEATHVEVLAITEQVIDNAGVYLGTDYLPRYEREELLAEYRREMLRLGHLLQAQGYRGVLGVDSILSEEGQLYPIIEMNARFTQVTYLLPVIEAWKAAGYRYMESRYVSFERREGLSFAEVRQRIENEVGGASGTRCLIYTYCAEKMPEQSLYRVFVLLAAQEPEQITRMKTGLDTFSAKVSEKGV